LSASDHHGGTEDTNTTINAEITDRRRGDGRLARATGVAANGLIAMSETPSQAKRFFSDRIIRQAGVEKVPLSKAERKMLFWSETDPESDGSAALDAAATLSTEMSDDEYEAKIRSLLRRAYEADCLADPQSKERWRAAAAVLENGDHYISIMVANAIGSKLRWWPQVWGARAVPAALGVIAICGAALFVAQRAVQTYLGRSPSNDEFGFSLWAIALAAGVVVGLYHAAKKQWDKR